MKGFASIALTASLSIAALPGTASAAATPSLAELQQEITQLRAEAQANADRNAVENLFSRYMYLHSGYQDAQIINLWVAKGTPDVRAQYSNTGVYTNWDNIMSYHRDRPHPIGKLLLHYTTTPLIEVAADGRTAKGLWVVSGVESGLTDPKFAANAPDYMYEKTLVDGKKVWEHTVLLKYGVDFLKQDGQWKIWHFHCFEVSRSPYGMGWIPFAAKAQNESFNSDLMYFGDDGRPVFMPKPDGPVTVRNNPYRTDTAQSLDARPPEPYTTFSQTFAY